MTTRTVLIVEDEDDVAHLEIALAALSGVNVVVLRSGRDAVKLLEAPSTDIAAVVTDLHLPHIDGYELLRTIRNDERWKRTPVVVVSGDSQPATAERLRTLGADAFFPKPYSPAEIRQKLKGLMNAD